MDCLPKHRRWTMTLSAHAAGLRPQTRRLNRNHPLTLIVAARGFANGLCEAKSCGSDPLIGALVVDQRRPAGSEPHRFDCTEEHVMAPDRPHLDDPAVKRDHRG